MSMGKKKDDSSMNTPRKSLTPTISFKKTKSPCKSSKKKPSTPFTKLVIRKIKELRKNKEPVEVTLKEDAKRKDVLEKKKKKSPIQYTKKSKIEITDQGKIKPSKPTSKQCVKNGVKEKEQLQKKKTQDKSVKKTKLKVSPLLGKPAKKMPKKLVETIPKTSVKGRRKSKDVVAESKVSFDSSPNKDGHLIECSPAKRTKESRPAKSICSNHMEPISEEFKDREHHSVPDSLVMSCSPDELSEPVVYGREEECDSLVTQDNVSEKDEEDSDSNNSEDVSTSPLDYNLFISILETQPQSVAGETIEADEEEENTEENPEPNGISDDTKDDLHSQSANSSSLSNINSSTCSSKPTSNSGEGFVTKSNLEEDKDMSCSVKGRPVEEANVMEEEEDMAESQKSQDSDSDIKGSSQKSEDYDLERSVELDSLTYPPESDSHCGGKESDMGKVVMKGSSTVSAESDLQCNELLPEKDLSMSFSTPEKENSSLFRTTIEDDLQLSTSVSKSSSRRSSISSGSVNGLYEMSKVKKSKKKPGPLTSKLTLKRRKDEKQNEEMLFGSSDSLSSSFSECSDNARKSYKRKSQNSPADTDEPQVKREHCESKNSSSLNISLEHPDIERFEERKCQLLPQCNPRGSESPKIRTSETSHSVSPLKVPKVVVTRLEENNRKNTKTSEGPSRSQETKQEKVGAAIKEARVLSKMSVFKNQNPVMRTELNKCKTPRFTELAFIKTENTNINPNIGNSPINFTLTQQKFISPNSFEDYSFVNKIERKVDILDCICCMGFCLNNINTDLHSFSEACSVSLTKIDCIMNDICDENTSLSRENKSSPKQSTKSHESNNHEVEENTKTQLISSKKQISPLCNDNSSGTCLSRSFSDELNRPAPGRTCSRTVAKQNKPEKCWSTEFNVSGKNLFNEEKESSLRRNLESKSNLSDEIKCPKINDRSLNNNLNSSVVSGSESSACIPNSELKKPKISKTDLIKRRRMFLKYGRSTVLNASRKTNELSGICTESPTATSQSKTFPQIPCRKVVNTNTPKPESVAPSFKQPQALPVKKIRNVITFEPSDTLKSNTCLNNNKIFNKPTPCIPQRTIANLKPQQQQLNSLKSTAHTSSSTDLLLPLNRRNNEDDVEDDNSSVISFAVDFALENFVNERVGPEPKKIGNLSNGNLGKNHFITSENRTPKVSQNAFMGESSREVHDRQLRMNRGLSLAKQIEERDTNSFQRQSKNNQMNDQGYEDQTRSHFKGRISLGSPQQQFNSPPAKNQPDSDEDEFKEEVPYSRRFSTNHINGTELANNMNEKRFGNPVRPNATEFPTEIEARKSRSRSNSSLSGSNNFSSPDNFSSPYVNVLRGTPFNGFCLFYLRSSVPKNEDHRCDLRHEVPGLLFSSLNAIGKDDLKKSTSEGIIRICKENCNNPPLRFLEGISTFCIKNDLKQELKNVIEVLKHSVSTFNVGIQKYKEIWTCFTKALVKHAVQWNSQPTTLIDTYLQNITIDENGQLTEPMSVILTEVLSDLAEMSTTFNSSLKLLNCVKFLNVRKDKLPANFYPLNFIEVGLGQFLSKARTISDKHTMINYAYLVYKTFCNSIGDCIYIHKNRPQMIEEFLSTAIEIFNHPSNKRQSKDCGMEAKTYLSLLQSDYETDRQPTSFLDDSVRENKLEYMNKHPGNMQFTQANLFNSLVRNNTVGTPSCQTMSIKEKTPKEAYESFKLKEVSSYLEDLHECEDSVKRRFNDTTMSLVLLESKKEDGWNNCYSLFKEIIQYDPLTVKDFTNENTTPVGRLLVIIRSCLKTQNLMDAVDLYLRYGLYKDDHSKWTLPNCPEDINLWKDICQDFKTAFLNFPQFNEINYSELFTSIIVHQKSLRTPVYLLTGLNNFFWKAANSNNGIHAMNVVVKTIVEEKLLKQLQLEDIELYRILITAVINAGDDKAPATCARLMNKFNTSCAFHLYPTSWARDSSDIALKTCLTTDELYAYFAYKIQTFKYSMSLFITFEEFPVDLESFKMECYRKIDCSVKGAIDRFRTVCPKIGLSLASILIQDNKITIDKAFFTQFVDD